MAQVLLQTPSDSEGYTRLYLAHPIGRGQAGEVVVSERDGVRHEITLHGQREFEVPDGTLVSFPDGSHVDLR